ncbi:MAG: linear amide C-N hydrolase, partial [Chloroflexota bacterium]
LLMIRVLLDYARDVHEALSLMGRYNVIMMGGPPVHYMLADAAGNSAVVEYVRYEMRVLRKDGPFQVATNFVLSDTSPSDADARCWRYRMTQGVLWAYAGLVAERDAIRLLGDVSQADTIWSVVYNLASGELQVAMGRHYERVRRFRLTMSGE